LQTLLRVGQKQQGEKSIWHCYTKPETAFGAMVFKNYLTAIGKMMSREYEIPIERAIGRPGVLSRRTLQKIKKTTADNRP